MAMSNTRMGDAMAAAVQAAGVSGTTPITNTQLNTIWENVAAAMITEFSGHASVSPGSFSNSGGAVAGIGGPVS